MKKFITCDSRIKVKSMADLIEMPVTIRVQEFNKESAEKFSESMSKAHETGQEIIPIIIDSYGGQVYSLLAMVDEIQSSTIPVATIIEGKAMSAGGILASMGTEGHRYMAENATFMIHDVSSFTFGKVEEIKADVHETDRLNKLIFELMARNCGKERNYFLDIIHQKGHADWYLAPREARRHNLINHIRVPEYHVKVEVAMEFE
jgi:ATP-dependent Clp protease, protease subunit